MIEMTGQLTSLDWNGGAGHNGGGFIQKFDTQLLFEMQTIDPHKDPGTENGPRMALQETQLSSKLQTSKLITMSIFSVTRRYRSDVRH